MTDNGVRHGIVGQFGWVSASRVVSALLHAVALVLLARTVAPSVFGLYAAAQGALLVTQSATGFGLGTLVVRERAQNRCSPVVVGALALNEKVALIYALAGGAAVALTGFWSATLIPLIPLVFSSALERSADVWLGVAIADGDAFVNAVNLVLRRLTSLIVFVVLLVFMSEHSLLAFGLASAIAASGSWFFARRFVANRSDASGTAIGAAAVVRLGMPYWVNSMATQLRNLDATVGLAVMSPLQAGFFGASTRLLVPLRLLPTSLAAVLLPVATRDSEASTRRVKKLLGLASLALVPLYFCVAALVPVFLPVLGQEYQGAASTIQVVVVALIPAGVCSLLTAVLQGRGHARFVSVASTAMSVLGLGGVALGGLLEGSLGAAIGLAVAYVLQLVVLGVGFQRLDFRRG